MTPPEPLAPQAVTASSSEDATDGTQGTWEEILGPELLLPNENGRPTLPKEWYDDPDDENKSIKAFLRYVEKEAPRLELHGLPTRGVVHDPEHGSYIQPRPQVGLQAADYAGHEDNLETEYVSLVRRVPSSSKAVLYRMVDGMWRAPKSVRDENGKDTRRVDRPVDIITEERTVADTRWFLGPGLTLMTTTMPNDSWRLGQLLGQDGSNPGTIAKSLSFAPRESELDNSEARSATSTGHVIVHPRDSTVGAGWGDYDKHIRWQSYGRRLTKDMVEEKEWSTDLAANFVNDAGEVVKTIGSEIKPEDLSARTPVSLYGRLHRDRSMPGKARQ
ncbi:unnamed protein product [Clonostachys byssicola]|uniref:Uncharacterized protein n=1 Tax=Clonostachys byssicola TaxID=160290 RepID=A0A9N9ULB1_9HYPO|nr:unnamed protein product [Clonostachys byssicola]